MNGESNPKSQPQPKTIGPANTGTRQDQQARCDDTPKPGAAKTTQGLERSTLRAGRPSDDTTLTPPKSTDADPQRSGDKRTPSASPDSTNPALQKSATQSPDSSESDIDMTLDEADADQSDDNGQTKPDASNSLNADRKKAITHSRTSINPTSPGRDDRGQSKPTLNRTKS